MGGSPARSRAARHFILQWAVPVGGDSHRLDLACHRNRHSAFPVIQNSFGFPSPDLSCHLPPFGRLCSLVPLEEFPAHTLPSSIDSHGGNVTSRLSEASDALPLPPYFFPLPRSYLGRLARTTARPSPPPSLLLRWRSLHPREGTNLFLAVCPPTPPSTHHCVTHLRHRITAPSSCYRKGQPLVASRVRPHL